MVNVIIGLAGLGLVIFLHELGHLLAAKSVGITVEAFSVGWGRKIWSRRFGETDYRLSWLPIGGYCKMQGEHALLRAWQERSSRIEVEPGDFYAAKPLHRIFVLIAGPAINFLFAVIVLAAVATIGYSIQTFPNRIVLAADYGISDTVAEEAGFRTGDRITSIAGERIETFREIQTVIGRSADETLPVTLSRDGETIETTIRPVLDPGTGAGRIGVYPWVEPEVADVDAASPAALAGIRGGDRIVAVDGTPVEHSIGVEHAIMNSGRDSIRITVLRDGEQRSITVIPDYDESGAPRLGIAYETLTVRSATYGLIGGIAQGFREAIDTLALTIRGIGLLFKGVDLNQALMGPVRITYMVGEVATVGFEGGFGRGALSLFNFLALISITLFFMNLLPIPVLDGGQIVLSFLEMIKNGPLHPRFVYHYQVVGNVIILALMFFALFNDILFFTRG
ncbi:MAG: RIP metalloprotease RseP [Alkalispirochaeta sp.]